MMALFHVVVGTFHIFSGIGMLVKASEYRRSISSCPSGTKEKVLPGGSVILPLTPFTLQFHMPSDAVTLCELAELSVMVDDYVEASFLNQLQWNNTTNQKMTMKTNLVSHTHSEQWGSLILEYETVVALSNDADSSHDILLYDELLRNSFESSLDDFMVLVTYLPEDNFFRDADNVAFSFAPPDSRTSGRINRSSTSIISQQFHLVYRLPEVMSPSAIDMLALEKLTNGYLQSFIQRELRISTEFIATFSTEIISHRAAAGWIDASFETGLDFVSNSTIQIPSQREFDQARKRAFSEHNLVDYTELLDKLPKTNAFAHTLFVRNDQNFDSIEKTSNMKSWSVENLILLMIFVIGVLITLIGAFLYQYPSPCCGCRRRKRRVVIGNGRRRIIRQRQNRAARQWEMPSKSYEQGLGDNDQATIISHESHDFDEESLPGPTRLDADPSPCIPPTAFTLGLDHDIIVQDEMSVVSSLSVNGNYGVLRHFKKKNQVEKKVSRTEDKVPLYEEETSSQDDGGDHEERRICPDLADPRSEATNPFDVDAMRQSNLTPTVSESRGSSLLGTVYRAHENLIAEVKKLRTESTLERSEQQPPAAVTEKSASVSESNMRPRVNENPDLSSIIPCDEICKIHSKSGNPFDDDSFSM